jgi:hypothetical protein
MRLRLPTRLCALLAGLATLAAGSMDAQAQDATARQDTPQQRTWARGGGGLGTFGAGQAVGFNLSLHHQRGAHLFSGRLTGASRLLGSSWNGAGLLYGRAHDWSWGHASAGAGMAYTWSEDTGDDAQTLGVPVQAQVYVAIPYTPLGVSLGGFGNANAERLFGGVTAGLVLGNLR